MQVDRPERGFSYSRQAPLDMRMDPSRRTSAADLIADMPERELADVIRTYGEERYARPIARAIVRRRAAEPITTTGDLVEVVRSAVPTPALFAGGHPAKRVFQALRIAVNDELDSLDRGLDAAWDLLAPGRPHRGHLLPLARGPEREAVARPHAGLHLPAGHPGVRLRQGAGGAHPHVEPVRPSERDHGNPRSASAKLRAAVKA